jgi:hypothetical protein
MLSQLYIKNPLFHEIRLINLKTTYKHMAQIRAKTRLCKQQESLNQVLVWEYGKSEGETNSACWPDAYMAA